MTTLSQDRASLRRTLRHARKSLTQEAQLAAAKDIVGALDSLPEIRSASVVAGYLPNDGEVSLEPFFVHLQDLSPEIRFALPVLHPFCPGHLVFLHYHDATPMKHNRFGIPEPACNVTDVIPTASLDVILLPLVGFDHRGNRLGMGGGFYDRTLAHRHRWASSPSLIGIAHECQQVDTLPVQSWDVPLDAIVTPGQIIRP